MSEKHLDSVNFEFIRYANCWEDADVLLKALELNSDSIVVSIASGGDNCFSLAAEGPKKVIAADISAVQLYLVELKMVAIKKYDRDGYLKFIGFRESGERPKMYLELRNELSEAAGSYWDSQSEVISNGIIHGGKFEQYFQLFKNDFLRSFHSQETVDELFRPKSDGAQLEFYQKKWFKEEWAQKHAIFFGTEMMGEKGRDPEFLKHVEGSVSESILKREVAQVKSSMSQNNFLLFYILNNHFDELHLPHYVRSENYERVKANLDKIVLSHGFLQEALPKEEKATHFNLSNIFEYMDEDMFKGICDDLIQNSAPGAKFAYWNFLIHRNMSDPWPEKISYEEDFSTTLSKEDMGYFYKAFNVNTKK